MRFLYFDLRFVFICTIIHYCHFEDQFVNAELETTELPNTNESDIPDAFGNIALQEADKEIEALEVNVYVQTARGAQFTPRYHRTYVKFTPDTEEIGKSSNRNIIAYKKLLNQGYSKKQAVKFLQKNRPPICKVNIRCQNSKYRTMDGTCNNRKNSRWGASFTPFSRLLPNVYKDAFNEQRGGSISTLPNARLISSTIHHDLILPDAILTNMVGQFGQFVDHDLTLTPEGDKRCCTLKGDVDCWPIKLLPNDTFYSSRIVPQTCMDFTRSTPYCFPTNLNSKGDVVREQFNILTSYADASNVYGSDYKRSKQLREFKNGRLRVSKDNELLLPTVKQVEEATNERIEFKGTFLAGDERVNEMPALAVLHTLFVREHNRIATQIQSKRPGWDDEKVFEETRRLVISQWQNILYGEYLPIVLGPDAMKNYKLELGTDLRQYSLYNSKLKASISHAFATAAYRFGHTLINGIIKLLKDLTPAGEYRLRDNFFKDDQIIAGGGDGYNRILEGLANQPSQTYDNFVTEDLGNFLLREDQNDFGADLLARNLQRGRDHGIPPYDDYRAYCGFPRLPTTFNEQPQGPQFTNGTWAKFKQLYRRPKDIDLFTGGLTELRVPGNVIVNIVQNGALTGPTFNCIKAKQFHRTKSGDRYFFTHKRQRGSFNESQLAHIRTRKFSDLICDNSNLKRIPVDVFTMVLRTSSNERISCDPTQSTKRVLLNIDLLLD